VAKALVREPAVDPPPEVGPAFALVDDPLEVHALVLVGDLRDRVLGLLHARRLPRRDELVGERQHADLARRWVVGPGGEHGQADRLGLPGPVAEAIVRHLLHRLLDVGGVGRLEAVLAGLHVVPDSSRCDLVRLRIPNSLRPSIAIGSKYRSTTRSLSGMMPLSVMLMCSGHTSVQHLVMLHMPEPYSLRISGMRSSVSSGCISRLASRIMKRGPTNSSCLPWSRRTWHTSWHRKHSMHLRNSCTRSASSWYMRWLPSASRGLGLNGAMRLFCS